MMELKSPDTTVVPAHNAAPAGLFQEDLLDTPSSPRDGLTSTSGASVTAASFEDVRGPAMV